MCVACATSYAQSGTNSPYSQYGIGVLSENPGAQSRGMNGLGIGFHENNQVNYLNPASYSSIDSLSFIFDAGASGQITQFKEQGSTFNARNGNFEYIIAGLRLAKHLGASFGFVPFTNVGYSYSNSGKIVNPNDGTVAPYTNTYNGEGGLHQAYLGLGWMPIKNFSIGVNASYMWGSYERSVVNQYTDASINTLSRNYTADFNSLHTTLGVQYTHVLSKKDAVTLGATYSFAHQLGAEPVFSIISKNSQTSVSDTTTYNAGKGMNLPSTLSLGLMWNHGQRLKLGVDYSLQKWSTAKTPVYTETNNVGSYVLVNNMYNDRHKVTLGGEFCPNVSSRHFFSRMRYRFGASLASSYLKINNIDGPKEFSMSAGVGIPIMNAYNSRSLLNISAQWVNQNSSSFIKENSFRINIGLTFNERWFAKWKVE